VEVVPLSEFSNRNPWLTRDEDDLPISVFYGFNMDKPPFDNVLVRQAFAAAIDRQVIADQALGYYFREAKPATTLTPSMILGRDLYNAVGIPFDPARAQELLRQAGYSSPADFPQVTLVVSTRGKGAPGAYYQMAKTAAGMWKTHLGVEVVIEAPDLTGWRTRVDAGDFDMYWLGWVADYNDPDNYLKALFRTGVDVNWARFSDPEFDRLVVEALRVDDPLERQLLYIQAERILTEDQTAILPLFHAYRPTPYVY
jgi:ABC-type oligopeptide transport system substrate-binding subunit